MVMYGLLVGELAYERMENDGEEVTVYESVELGGRERIWEWRNVEVSVVEDET